MGFGFGRQNPFDQEMAQLVDKVRDRLPGTHPVSGRVLRHNLLRHTRVPRRPRNDLAGHRLRHFLGMALPEGFMHKRIHVLVRQTPGDRNGPQKLFVSHTCVGVRGLQTGRTPTPAGVA